jgi:hypothetical protein
MEVEAIAEQVVSALACKETVRRIAITPRYAEDPTVGGGSWER